MSDEKAEVMDLLMQDLDATAERLYVASLRYVRVFERDLLSGGYDGEGETVGNARGMLVESAEQSEEAYNRCAKAGWFESSPPPDQEESENES